MPQIILKPGRSKPIENRHSWIFQGAAAQNSHPTSVGIAEVLDENGKVLGYGFTDPDSQLICRVFHFGKTENPKFDLNYWKERFWRAFHYRNSFLDFSQTNSYRLVHAEGDELPGLIVDIYGEKTAVLHTTIDATGQWYQTWKNILNEMGYEYIFHKHAQQKNGKWLGPIPEVPILSKENNLLFAVEVETGQKTGFFIDQRDNRQIIKTLSTGKKVLNAFSFSGGFSVYAISGGAREVVSVDISKEACQLAEHNVSLNFPDFKSHQAIAIDCFEYLRNMPSDFDLIILDPPAFAKSKNAIDSAARGYKEINLNAFKKIKSGGFIATFSCSQHVDKELFRKIVFAAAADSGRKARLIHFFSQAQDHPINLFQPESEYLKGLLIQVED
jgi:23S rRNA (cytosine1962-C5)-methyltransferase